MSRTRSGRPTRPRPGHARTAAARCSCSSTTPRTRSGTTPPGGWTASPPLTCSARSAASASARSSARFAAGLALRYDGGSCFRYDHYQAEIDHLSIARSPAFHYEPETNGCAEKAIQTLKEQLLWIERFDTLDELRTAVLAFGRTYNQHWLIERHGYLTPTEARQCRCVLERQQRSRPEARYSQQVRRCCDSRIVAEWRSTKSISSPTP